MLEAPSVWDARLRTEPRATGDEMALLVRGLLGTRLGDVTAVAALSTVPALLHELRGMVTRHFPGFDHLLVEPAEHGAVR